jgi:L-lactate dehydrogenase complex protein LldG
VSDARIDVLGRIRQSLAAARSELGTAPAAMPVAYSPGSPSGLDSAAERRASFTLMLERVGARVHVARDATAAAEAVAGIALELGARTVAVSDDPAARAACAGTGASLVEPGESRAALLAADLGVTGAQLGIAETGTLVLDHGAERHRLASLVPPVHVAILEADSLVGTLGDALAHFGGRDGLARGAITFVTGPSRTADIELTLVVGVHGPRALHVVLIEPGVTP